MGKNTKASPAAATAATDSKATTASKTTTDTTDTTAPRTELLDTNTACDRLGVSKRMVFVAEKRFGKGAKKPLTEWEALLKGY